MCLRKEDQYFLCQFRRGQLYFLRSSLQLWAVCYFYLNLELFFLLNASFVLFHQNQIRDPLTNEKLLPPSKIYVKLQTQTMEKINQTIFVRAVINQIHTFHLVDVGIKGGNRSEFENSRCSFSGLKFDTTSYNHEGAKFHLVIVVYLNQNKFEHPKILESRISPPIFVDSRKSARDTQQQKVLIRLPLQKQAQKLSSFIDPFLPESMDKKFVKRESKRKDNFEEPIENNIEGLSNFFSAPNIRHKVKHPLFLAIRFCNNVKIYYNMNIIPFNTNNEKFVEVLQKQLMETYNRSGTTETVRIEDKPLILTIEHSLPPQNLKQKKINEFLEPLHGDVLHVMIDPQSIPSNFKKLEDIEGIKEAYRKVYPKISQHKFLLGVDEHNDQDNENEGGPCNKTKKTKNMKGKLEKETILGDNDSPNELQSPKQLKKMKSNQADQKTQYNSIGSLQSNSIKQCQNEINQSVPKPKQQKQEKSPKTLKSPKTKGKRVMKNPLTNETISMHSSQQLSSQIAQPQHFTQQLSQIGSSSLINNNNMQGIQKTPLNVPQQNIQIRNGIITDQSQPMQSEGIFPTNDYTNEVYTRSDPEMLNPSLHRTYSQQAYMQSGYNLQAQSQNQNDLMANQQIQMKRNQSYPQSQQYGPNEMKLHQNQQSMLIQGQYGINNPSPLNQPGIVGQSFDDVQKQLPPQRGQFNQSFPLLNSSKAFVDPLENKIQADNIDQVVQFPHNYPNQPSYNNSNKGYPGVQNGNQFAPTQIHSGYTAQYPVSNSQQYMQGQQHPQMYTQGGGFVGMQCGANQPRNMHTNGGAIDQMNQLNNGFNMNGQYQSQQQNTGGYRGISGEGEGEEEALQYLQKPLRYSSAQQNNQFKFNQELTPHNPQNNVIPSFSQQQQQNLGNYGENPTDGYPMFPRNNNSSNPQLQEYMKQGVNLQFQQFYQPQQQGGMDFIMNNVSQGGQGRPASKSIQNNLHDEY